MSTLDSQLITNQALQATAKVNSGQSHLAYTKIVFSSDDLTQKSDDEIKNLTSFQNEELTATPKTYVTADNTIKATATADNKELKNSFNVKAYGLYAKLDDGNEFLFAVNISSTADYMPAFDGSNTSEVSYGFGFKFAETQNIELTDYNVVSVSKEDLNNSVKESSQSTLSSANAYTDHAVADKATQDDISTAKSDLQKSIDTKANKTDVDSAISEANSSIATKADKTDVDSAVKNINENISKKSDQSEVDSINQDVSEMYPNVIRFKGQHAPFNRQTIDNFTDPCIVTLNGQWLSDFADYKDEYDIRDNTLYLKVEKYGKRSSGTEVVSQTAYATKTVIKRLRWGDDDTGTWQPWIKIGGGIRTN